LAGLATALRGRLDASFAPADDGVRASYSATSPLELRGPLHGADSTLYYLRNVTAGVFGGDCYDVRLRTESGARVQIASSSATKVFTMPGGDASYDTHLHAELASVLVWGPHAAILQTGASFRQSTRIHVEPGAIILVAEVIAFGRLATGEQYAFHRFENELVVYSAAAAGAMNRAPTKPESDENCAPVFEERYTLVPSLVLTPLSAGGEGSAKPGVRLPDALGGHGVLATVHALGVPASLLPSLNPVIDATLLAGAGALPNEAGLVARALCNSLSEGMTFVEGCIARLLQR
jgi:urease accessory protein UreH